MPFCNQCGTKLQEIDHFCGNCGLAQKNEVQKEPPASSVPPPTEPEAAQNSTNQQTKYKGVGIRFVAQIVDSLICLIMFGIIGSFVAGLVGGTTTDGFELEGSPAAMVQLLTLVVSILYFTILESYWNGQTLGKKITGIQVICEDGSLPTFSISCIRNIMRIVDGFGFYLVAAIFVWTSSTNQRLGDRVAHTYVVKKNVKRTVQQKKKNKKKFTSNDDVYISDFD